MIHVCSLARLHDTVETSGASHVVTLINSATEVVRPASIVPENHLLLGMNDIISPMEGMVLPGEAHVAQLLEFVTAWPGEKPIVIHCWAGISRSTAAGFITLCARHPEIDEEAAALHLRSLSPTATPNGRLVALADAMLGRGGRRTRAVEAIGRGAFAGEGDPFMLDPAFGAQRG